MSDKASTGRLARIAVGGVLIPAIGALAFSMLWGIAFGDPLAILLFLPFSLGIAFWQVGVQAVIYSLLMELVVWPLVGLNSRGVFIGALLGLACGLSVFLLGGDFLTPLMYTGFVAGLVVGLCLCVLRRRSEVTEMDRVTSPVSGIDPGIESSGTCFFDQGVSQ